MGAIDRAITETVDDTEILVLTAEDVTDSGILVFLQCNYWRWSPSATKRSLITVLS